MPISTDKETLDSLCMSAGAGLQRSTDGTIGGVPLSSLISCDSPIIWYRQDGPNKKFNPLTLVAYHRQGDGMLLRVFRVSTGDVRTAVKRHMILDLEARNPYRSDAEALRYLQNLQHK